MREREKQGEVGAGNRECDRERRESMMKDNE